MKLCLFSDIHGNADAFRIAHKKIVYEAADVNVFLGDLCGYYYDQMEIFYLLGSMQNLTAIKGNHDVMFLSILDGDRILQKKYFEQYGSSMEGLLKHCDKEVISWLRALPESLYLEDATIAGYHGAPWDNIDGYVYPDSPLDGFTQYPQALFLLGHTHYPMQRSISAKTIVNPGSLGQPRNGDWPSFAILDTERNELKLEQVVYDKTALLKRIHQRGDSQKYLENILFR